jgi:PAS domain S-box-containing protein
MLAAVLVAAGAIGAVSAHRYADLERELTGSALDRRQAIATLAAATYSEKLDRVVDIGVSLATRVRFQELVAAGRWDEAVRILERVPLDFSFVDRVFLADRSGTLQADVPALPGVRGRNFSDREWFRGVSGAWAPYVSPLYRREALPQRDVIAIAVPIRDTAAAVTGILVLQVKLESFFQWAAQLDVGPDARVLVLDHGGRAAFDSQPQAEGVESLVRFEAPAARGWRVVVLQPERVAFAARDAALRRVALDGVLIAVLAIAAGGLGWVAMARRRREEAARAHSAGLEQAHEVLSRQAERLRIVHDIDRAIIAEANPEAIAAAVIDPVRRLLGAARAIVNLFDHAAGEVEWLAAAGRHRVRVGPGVRYSMRLMGDLAAMKRGEPQKIDVGALPAGPETQALLDSGVRQYIAVPMIAGGELIGALSYGGDQPEFPAEQVAIAQEVATQLAIAIAQARLFRRLGESERRYSDLLGNVHLAAVMLDRDGRITYCNDFLLRLTGWRAEELIGQSWIERVVPADNLGIRDRFAAIVSGRAEGRHGENEIVTRDGERRVMHWSNSVLRAAGGEVVGLASLGEDITERKRAEQEIRALNATLEQRVAERTAELDDLYNRAPCGYHSVDGDGLIVRMNDTWLAWLGYARGEVVGKMRHAELMTPASAAKLRGEAFPLFRSQGWLKDVEFEYRRKDGSTFPGSLNATSVLDADGRFVMSRSTVVDITERKRIESELQAANRELEGFSYSVSHDLRAPLRAIDGYARMLEEDFGPRLDAEGRRLLGVVRANAMRMGQLIDDLLAFSRVSRTDPLRLPVDMGALAREAAGEVADGAAAPVEFEALPPARGDRALLKQVWVNLVANACKFSAKRERPQVRVGGKANGTELVYWVRDNGAGFDPRYAGKLFGVFQRLHRDDEFPGTGVGLAIVQRVVTRHGGRVWAEGEQGKGACFYFSLPKEG